MTRYIRRAVLIGAFATGLAAPGWAFEQDPARGTQQGTQTQQQPPARGPRGQARQGQRPALPPVGPNMDQQQLQAWLDAYALVQAERELQLTGEQYPDFVSRLTRLHTVRRRVLAERRRMLGELRILLQGATPPRDELVDEKVRALDELARRAGDELRKSYQEVDAVLTPWQRGRFRLFEEQLERRKIELLSKIATPPGR